MKRGNTGRYELARLHGEEVRAFIPSALPPTPALEVAGPLAQLLESATVALGRLDSVTTLLPDPALFLYAYIRKEAVYSSQIEGTQSSLSDLLLFEMNEVPGVPLDDVVEVSNYVSALHHGFSRLREGFPISTRLLREIHGVLLRTGRGSAKDPGELRRSQNWIGGSRPGNAAFVPPPPGLVAECMTDLERYLHDASPALPVLVRAGLAHVQFETIHPFLDGNGRVGRLLVPLLLCDAGLLREPLLYLSLYLKQHRATYYELLDVVRRDGDWERWLLFFLEGVRETADGAFDTTRRLGAMFAEHRRSVSALGRKGASALKVLASLESRPLLPVREIARRADLSFPAAASALELLRGHGLVQEVTGRRRNRIYAYTQYLAILNEGAATSP